MIRVHFSRTSATTLVDTTGAGADGPFILYGSQESATAIHSRLGGAIDRRYAQMSGGVDQCWGSIPGSAGIVAVNTYMVNDGRARFSSSLHWTAWPRVGQVFVPVDQKTRALARDWPILIGDYTPLASREGDVVTGTPLVLLRPEHLLGYLDCRRGAYGESIYELPHVAHPSLGQHLLRVPTRFDSAVDEAKLLEVVAGVYEIIVGFRRDGYSTLHNPFWERLGIQPLSDGKYYLVNGGIASRAFTRDELTLDLLRQIAPRNTHILRPNFYVQVGERGEWEGVGLFRFGDSEEVNYEAALDGFESYDAIQGRFGVALRKCRQGARRKWLRSKGRYFSLDRLLDLARPYEHLFVTVDDSVVAGNCQIGTQAFAARHFAGRERVTVGELLKYVRMPEVKAVIAHKVVSALVA